MMRFAVIGNPIAHSLSPLIHQKFAAQTGIALRYEKILSDADGFADCVKNFFRQGGIGLNITAPFKHAAFELADIKTDRCLAAQTANTLWKKNGYMCADNTDGVGLVRDLEKYTALQDRTVLILGAGGAAQGIIPALHAASVAKIALYNRTASRIQRLLKSPLFEHFDLKEFTKGETYDIIIHATSANWQSEQKMMTNNVWLQACLPSSLCYDINYCSNGFTPFVVLAQRAGITACDGLGMLVEQAAEAFFDWHGVFPETKEVLPILRN